MLKEQICSNTNSTAVLVGWTVLQNIDWQIFWWKCTKSWKGWPSTFVSFDHQIFSSCILAKCILCWQCKLVEIQNQVIATRPMPENYESFITIKFQVIWSKNKSNIEFKCSNSNSRSCSCSRQSNEMFTSNITSKKWEANLKVHKRKKEIGFSTWFHMSIWLTGKNHICLPARKKPLTVFLFGLHIAWNEKVYIKCHWGTLFIFLTDNPTAKIVMKYATMATMSHVVKVIGCLEKGWSPDSSIIMHKIQTDDSLN